VRTVTRLGLICGTLLLAALSTRTTAAQEQQVEISPANKLYLQAVTEAERASKLERRGKLERATHAYELAGRLSEGSIAEAERTGVAEQGRPPQVYFLCATSYLHAGRLLSQMKEKDRDEERLDAMLDKAARYLGEVEKIEAERAQKAGSPVNPEIWRVRNATAYVHFLRGQLAQARLAYTAVLEMNPTYKPAELAIAEINKLERRENELFSPQGRTMDKENRRKTLKEVVKTLRLVRDIVTLGR
jgi:tetratricopeptide (TPR) repeat protein